MEPRPLLFLTLTHQQGRECTKSCEETHPGRLVPTEQRDSLHPVVSRSAVDQGRCSKWWCWSSQVTIMCNGALLPWGWLNTWLPIGKGNWIPCFPLLVQTLLPSLLDCPYLNLWVFFFFPSNSSPIPSGGLSKWICGAQLQAGVNQESINKFTMKENTCRANICSIFHSTHTRQTEISEHRNQKVTFSPTRRTRS